MYEWWLFKWTDLSINCVTNVMQCKGNNEDIVSGVFLISAVSFEQGTMLYFISEQEKGPNPITTKGILKKSASGSG